MSIVVKARRAEKGIIVHELDNGEIRQYIAVRGGLSWPLMTEKPLPAYCCIVGEELISAPQREQNQRGKLIFLREYEAPDILLQSEFFTKLTDDAHLFECNTFYTVTKEFRGEDYSGCTERFQRFVYENKIAVHLEEAPWAADPDHGIGYIKEWMKKGLLELPEESIVRNQLKMLVDQKLNQVPQMFNAVNALSFVICSFEKYKPSLTEKDWRKRQRGTWRSA